MLVQAEPVAMSRTETTRGACNEATEGLTANMWMRSGREAGRKGTRTNALVSNSVYAAQKEPSNLKKPSFVGCIQSCFLYKV